MYKNILAYELTLFALLMLPSTIIATNVSKNPSAEKIPLELQRDQSQQPTPQRMKRVKFAEELPDELKKIRLIHSGIRGGV
ncbi:hypothetical protein [Nitrosomonas ureae]|uniref:Uncharacterized protein n=1 Tax=Nitrosomonas ureae TaxID=44577 RepID=A0A0S3AJM5_9PROT|nr:hypothetical protein [Nitrosomonas ureae]ALQ51405.1 hypothetical protein ATY38_09365 [Nitrosomonas ureae]PTQ81074.1 hypothetical protein C8R28_103422 [Nitrosomonas ureae]SDU10383.1 hypothetical protein SAMN05216406_12423 [Nitrosomonas ureae]